MNLIEQSKDLMSYAPEHKGMIAQIKEKLPEIKRATSFFGKKQSQFMDNLLTVSHNTPLRNMRQIMSEITRAREALQEAYYKQKKEEIEVKKLVRSLEKENDPLERELIELKIEEIQAKQESSKYYISGAIRKISALLNQYDAISEKHGCKDFNEFDFEKEEERYHITKAFSQALTAARSKGGIVDEGNHIYFYQIGINGAAAQLDIIKYLKTETAMLEQKQQPTYKMLDDFLNRMADKYIGCAEKALSSKGMLSEINKRTLLLTGDK